MNVWDFLRQRLEHNWIPHEDNNPMSINGSLVVLPQKTSTVVEPSASEDITGLIGRESLPFDDDDTIVLAEEVEVEKVVLEEPAQDELTTISETGRELPKTYRKLMFMKGKQKRADDHIEQLEATIKDLKKEISPYKNYSLLCDLIPYLELGRASDSELEFKIEGGKNGVVMIHGHSLSRKTSNTILKLMRNEFLTRVDELGGLLFNDEE
jgi:hypothetical protein